jgi:hypothetical protein
MTVAATMSWLVFLCGLATAIAAAQTPESEYEIGGPLAGLRLPLYPT